MLKKHGNAVIAPLGVRIGPTGIPVTKSNEVVKEDWTLETENHPHWSSRKKWKYHTDIGGNFRKLEVNTLRMNSEHFDVRFNGLTPLAGYRGVLINGFTPSVPVTDSVDVLLTQLAPYAYSRMKPTKPSFDGIRELLELRDLVSLTKLRMEGAVHDQLPRLPGKSWLYTNMAAAPLIKSMIDLYQAYHGWEKRLKWLLDNEGEPIRTRVQMGTFSSQSNPVETTGNNETGLAIIPSDGFASGTFIGQWRRRDWSGEKSIVWASACFRYWLPKGPRDVVWTYKMKRRLFGIDKFSISQIYDAYPWTWLIGWFSNAATVLQNLEAEVADRLAADWFYMMGTKVSYNVSELSTTVKASPWGPQKALYSRVEVSKVEKRRLRGDPFGLNTNPANLSGIQLSILGSLGISKLPRS
jgi:hypothetical protein